MLQCGESFSASSSIQWSEVRQSGQVASTCQRDQRRLHLDSESLAVIGVAVAEVDENRAGPIPEIILLRAGCGLGVLDEGA